MASNIDLRRTEGVGPEARLIESHLLRSDGSIRPQRETGWRDR